MDLLYSRYTNPTEFMNAYIMQGRFGEFVDNILKMDRERKKETAQKKQDDRLWLAYIHSMSEQSFHDWKNELMGDKEPTNYAMTDKQSYAVKNRVKGILNRITPV